jgi:hypothetical protein
MYFRASASPGGTVGEHPGRAFAGSRIGPLQSS